MRLPFFVHAVIQCITAQLQDRQLRLESAGSIAQAALELNNVFAAAQADADSLKAQAQQECDAMIAAAQKRTQTEADCKAMVEQAEQEVQQRWQAFDRKANELLDQYRSTDGLPSEET